MGERSMGCLPEERIERFVWGAIDWRRVALKQPCTGGAAQRDGSACDFEPRALAKAENGRGVFFVEFADTFFTGFMCRGCGGVGVNKMWIDLKRDKA